MASANLVITNHSGEMFPRLLVKGEEAAAAAGGEALRYMFDRVLADVPCSGGARLTSGGLTGGGLTGDWLSRRNVEGPKAWSAASLPAAAAGLAPQCLAEHRP
jgi:hypothetical protein